MTSVEIGVLAAAAKNPAMPTMTNVAGCGARAGHRRCSTTPRAPPPQPPITIDGPNTPPDPPPPIVSPVVRILPTATASRTAATDRLPSPARRQHERVLEDAVAERQHRQHRRVVAVAVEGDGQQPAQKRPDGRLD